MRSQDYSASPVQVLAKAATVMDCFTIDDPTLHIGEVKRRSGLPPTTTARLLLSLVAENLLEREGDIYRAGLRVLAWSASAAAGSDLISLGSPLLKELRDETEETASLQVRNGAQRITVATVESLRSIVCRTRVGGLMVMHAGASGKAFMAFDPAAHDAALRAGLTRFTPSTITDEPTLAEHLDGVRRAGVAVARDEREQGLSSVACPVFGSTGRVVGTMALSVPSFRLDEQTESRLVEATRRTAAVLSGRLGHIAAADPALAGTPTTTTS
ncbi:IclR family transcriptional regulator [Pseudonocardia broussonetiae]|uniref:IclR family transcriptional regulator n=1 Tax=Pseudonocardia broussonetiae TaxID=2736640 RepID=A0A6M6JRQ4_9PSEU|nr:IclR family transcriptional regulator [Pseudonocardia broussonetiae]QJY50000.1 IclR family transcriptional regulator [Pseudonocardia broussonetiae]